MSSEVSSGRPAQAMHRTIQRLKAWDAMISPNSTSDSSGAEEARWAEETMASRTDTDMDEADKGRIDDKTLANY
ncbi:hypothetical protein D3C78_1784460 [compost metagenome]